MEAHLSTHTEDGLLDSLNFRPPGNSANYVIETRKVKFFAEASDRFSTNSRVLRFRLVDQGFLEPASSRIEFTLNNKDSSNALVPVAPPLAMFSRIRVFISGVQCENWDYVGETCVLMDRLKGAARRNNDSVESHFLTAGGYADTYQAIPASSSRSVLFSIPCGVTQMDKWMPLSLVSGGVVLECELSSDSGQAFDVSTNAANWDITDVSMLANLHTVDSSLANSYAKHILSGNSINYHTKSMVVTKHLLTDSSFTIPIVRGYSRLCQVYVTLHKGSSATEKAIRDFYHPCNNNVPTTATDNCTLQITIGSRRFPERPQSSVAEQWLRLREAAGVFYGESDLAILPTDYVNRKAIFGWDLEKVGHQGASHSGLSTKNGDILTLDVKNTGLGASGDYALIYLVFENLFALRDGSIDVYD